MRFFRFGDFGRILLFYDRVGGDDGIAHRIEYDILRFGFREAEQHCHADKDEKTAVHGRIICCRTAP